MKLLAVVEGNSILYQKKPVGLSDTLEKPYLTSSQNRLESVKKEVGLECPERKAQVEGDTVRVQ